VGDRTKRVFAEIEFLAFGDFAICEKRILQNSIFHSIEIREFPEKKSLKSPKSRFSVLPMDALANGFKPPRLFGRHAKTSASSTG